MWELSLPEGLGKRGGFTMAFCLAYLQIYLYSILLHTIVLTIDMALERLGRVREVPP